jgi:hypothetical protein
MDSLDTISPSDLDEDIAATERGREQIARFFARADEAVRPSRMRGWATGLPGVQESGVGHELVARCSEETQIRWRTLVYFETSFPSGGDYGFLIGPACQIVESELDRLLTVPAAPLAEHLIAALHRPKDRGLADVLRKWAARQVPTTLLVQVGVLLALQRGCEEGTEAIEHFLTSRFQPRYRELLLSHQVPTCLNIVRNDFRNQSCHPLKTFDAGEYEQFARLIVARAQLATWIAQGPEPAEPDASVGILHHHLCLSCPGLG